MKVIDSMESIWDVSDATISIVTFTGEHNGQKVNVSNGAKSEYFYKELSPSQDWSSYNEIRFWIYSSRESKGGDTDNPVQWELEFNGQTFYIEIKETLEWIQKRIWIKGLAVSSISQIKFTCLNDEDENDTYFSQLIAVKESMIPDVELALKTKLETMGYPVHIKSPEAEIVSEGTYPVISLYNFDMIKDSRRGVQGTYLDNYDADGKVERWQEPQPYILAFQIDLFSKYARDDRKIVQEFLELFPENYSYLEVNGLDIEILHRGYVSQDTLTGKNERIYRKVFTIDVMTAHEWETPITTKTVDKIIFDNLQI